MHTAGIQISIMSFIGAEWESAGARCVLCLQLTDEQPCFCAEPRGPRSVSGEDKVEEEEKLCGFIGALAAAMNGACSHSMKTRGRGEVGGGAVVGLVSRVGVVVAVGT